ncbi:MAG: type II secretion system F family protein [Opitutales bacterium]|nr:type II secretion system F family protein [Opitutales bacterium]
MPEFSYRAIDTTGRSIAGKLEALDRKSVLRKLGARGMRPVSVDQLSAAETTDSSEAENMELYGTAKKSRFAFFNPKRSKSALALEFTKRLLMLLEAGMAIGDAVRLMSTRIADPQMKDLCNTIWKKLSEGHTLAAALDDLPQSIFSPSTIHLIEAGEASGSLVPVMRRIVAYLEETAQVKKDLIANLSYPAFILSVAFAVVIILIVYLIPQIEGMLQQLGGEMPTVTKILLGGTDALVRYGPFLLGGGLLAAFGIAQWRKTAAGKKKSDRMLLRVPLLGKIYLYANIYATTNLLGTLLTSGVNTTEALRLVERTINNTILRAKFAAARRQIQEGVSVATAIQRVRYMPDIAMDILTVGENTGNIVSSLNDINRIYREELTKLLNRLTTLTASIALGCAIGLVAIIAVSVVLSVLSVGQSLQM